MMAEKKKVMKMCLHDPHGLGKGKNHKRKYKPEPGTKIGHNKHNGNNGSRNKKIQPPFS
jgi:hypothetical protein